MDTIIIYFGLTALVDVQGVQLRGLDHGNKPVYLEITADKWLAIAELLTETAAEAEALLRRP